MDEATSKRIAELVTSKGGVFLEAPVSGSKKPAIDGALIFLCGGDAELYARCQPAFDIMGKKVATPHARPNLQLLKGLLL